MLDADQMQVWIHVSLRVFPELELVVDLWLRHASGSNIQQTWVLAIVFDARAAVDGVCLDLQHLGSARTDRQTCFLPHERLW